MVAGQGPPVYPNDISGDGGLTAGNNPQAFVDATALNPAPVQGGGGKRKQRKSKSKKRGTAFDVIKPKNWKAPDIEQIIYEEREKKDENTGHGI